jgi:uncharacterized membrane protein YgcG
MFDGRESLHLDSYDEHFAEMWNQLDAEMTAWADTSGLWEQRGRNRRRLARIFGPVAAVAGAAVILAATAGVARIGAAFLWLLVLAGVVSGLGLTALTANLERMVRTPEGSRLWEQVESFRRFLHDGGGPPPGSVNDTDLLFSYVAWAVALWEDNRFCADVPIKVKNLVSVGSPLVRQVYTCAHPPSSRRGGYSGGYSGVPSGGYSGGYSGGDFSGGGGGDSGGAGGGGGSW